jgi:integrase
MPGSWIIRRETASGPRYRVLFRLGGRESAHRYAGSFPTKTEALIRKRWVDGELAALRVPDLKVLEQEVPRAPSLCDVATRWQKSRVDVRESTTVQHRTALGRVLPTLGERPLDSITPADVAELVAKLVADGKARESIRKSVTALAMVLDFAGLAPNPARDRVQVRLPREEPEEPEPPSAMAVEAVAWQLTVPYLLGLLVLDATGCRVGEHEDRDPSAPLFPGVTADRLRMAIGRACRDAGVPRFAPHVLRHRRISLLHRLGRSWAEVNSSVRGRA